LLYIYQKDLKKMGKKMKKQKPILHKHIKGLLAAFLLIANAFGTNESEHFSGGGLQSNPFRITTAQELAQFAALINSNTQPYSRVNTHFRLESPNDTIDLSGIENWTPIGRMDGTAISDFRGNFDGNGNVIVGLTINRPDQDNLGLFGTITVESGFIRNFGIVGANIVGRDRVGGVASGVSLSGRVSNVFVSGSIRGRNYVGGIAGSMGTGGRIVSSFSTAEVSGEDAVGGLVGYMFFAGGAPPSILNSAALNPSVRGTGDNIGRVVGRILERATLTSNVAFLNMLGNFGNTDFALNQKNGASFSAQAINADGSIDGRFNNNNGWIWANGSLPGLVVRAVGGAERGAPQAMPPHLIPQSGTVSNSNLLLPPPLAGMSPIPQIFDPNGQQWVAQITWYPAIVAGGIFEANTEYTATISINPTYGRTLSGVAENFFRINGLEPRVQNKADEGVFSHTFPKTGEAFVRLNMLSQGQSGENWTFSDDILTVSGNVSAPITSSGIETHRRIAVNGESSITIYNLNIKVLCTFDGCQPIWLNEVGTTLNLTLAEGGVSYLSGASSSSGIVVRSNRELIIDGTGTLHTFGTGNRAGIENHGKTTIKGGVIYATGGERGTSVGGRSGVIMSSDRTTIISGNAQVIATAGGNSAALGGGEDGSFNSPAPSGKIIIEDNAKVILRRSANSTNEARRWIGAGLGANGNPGAEIPPTIAPTASVVAVGAKVNFNPNGGTLSGTSPQIISTENHGAALQPDPTRPAHKFDGWFTSPTNGDRVELRHIHNHATLYAQWTPNGATNIRPNTPHNDKFGILLENAIVSDVARISVIPPEQATVNLVILDNLGNVVFSADDVRADPRVCPNINAAQNGQTQGSAPTPIVWNLTNQSGRFVANGTYLVLVEATGISGKVYRYSTRIGVNR